MHLDRIDLALLEALRKNARLPTRPWPSRSASPLPRPWSGCGGCTRPGSSRATMPKSTPRPLGIGLQAMISVRLERHARIDVAAFHAYLKTLPEVLSF